MAIKLTVRQQQILDLIRHQLERTGFPPTRAEIARELGFRSANAAEDHLRALAKKGAIALTAGASRGIRLLSGSNPANAVHHPDTSPSGNTLQGAVSATTQGIKSGVVTPLIRPSSAGALTRLPESRLSDHLLLPVVGRVAAGSPILAAEHVDREISVEPALFTQTPDYLLKVRGLSMRNAGILDGDLLAVKKVVDARNGQIVVARLGDDVTVKRLQRQGKHVTLLPENPDFEPIVVTPADDFTLEGIAVGLIRTLQ
ncbi:MAG: transcriptional repressor LexA [Pusillimonas sp.]